MFLYLNPNHLSEAETSRADGVLVLMDDAIDVHPVEDGLRLGRLDRMDVHLLASVGHQDGRAVAHVLLQTRPEG